MQIMSSMASQEFDERPYESDQVKAARAKLQGHASNRIHFKPLGRYGMQKTIIEQMADYYALHHQLDVNVPRLAGVLNAHTPWPSNGTTEELDKLVVAAALHEVYPEDWEQKLQATLNRYHPEAAHKRHYIQNKKYVPEVAADATFDMVDGKTLPEAVLMLLHRDMRGRLEDGGIGVPGAVHNVSEYSVSMGQAAEILRRLNPAFPLEFKNEPNDMIDLGKMDRARTWPTAQDVESTIGLIGEFRERPLEKSIREAYRRVVEHFRGEKLAAMESIAVEARVRGAGAIAH